MKTNIIISIISAIALSTFASTNADAQNVVPVGTNLISVDLGLGSTHSYRSSATFPVTASYERIVFEPVENFSLGIGGLGTMGISDGISTTGLFLFVAAHYTVVDNLDLYAGPAEGYLSVGYDGYSIGSASSGFFAGARYFFNDKLAAHVQIGTINPIDIGLSIRF